MCVTGARGRTRARAEPSQAQAGLAEPSQAPSGARRGTTTPKPRRAQPSRAEPSQAPPGHGGAWRGMAGHGEGAAGHGMARRGMAGLPGSLTYNRTRDQFRPGTGTKYAMKLHKSNSPQWMSLLQEFELMKDLNHPSFVRCAARHLSP